MRRNTDSLGISGGVQASLDSGLRSNDRSSYTDGTLKMALESASYNYPSKDPIFHVLKVPQLTIIPDPKPPRKAPLAGYDMKTLRNQVEFLQSEIDDRTETQRLLFTQNDELWVYSRTLLECNKKNAVLMQQQVIALHEELQELHEERFLLSEKLESAEHSKELFLRMSVELTGARGAVTSAQRMALEAEEALKSVRKENIDLELSLSSQVSRMRDAHRNLDLQRTRRMEDSAYETAEVHFSHSKTTLRGAYSRFSSIIKKRLKVSNISKLFQALNKSFLKQKVLHLWRAYSYRIKMMLSNSKKRSTELLSRVLKRWQENTTQEKRGNSGRRHLLLKTMMGSWVRFVKTNQWDAKADEAVIIFKNRQCARKVFSAWKSQCIFLEWDSEQLKLLGRFAVRHHFCKILRAWLTVAKLLKRNSNELEVQVPSIFMPRPFQAWKLICRRIWRRRGNLVGRFYANIRRMITLRLIGEKIKSDAIVHWVGVMKYYALGVWINWIRLKKRIRSPRYSTRLFSLACRASFLHIAYRSISSKRQRLCVRAAVRTYYMRTLATTIKRWRRHIRKDRKKRENQRTNLLVKMFACWCIFVPMQRSRRQLADNVERKFNRADYRIKIFLFTRWRLISRRNRRISKCENILQNRRSVNIKRKIFCFWRCKWMSILFWKIKEQKLETERCAALIDLKKIESEHLEADKLKLQDFGYEMQKALFSLETSLVEKEKELFNLNEQLNMKEKEKVEAQKKLEIQWEETTAAREERERMKEVEKVVEVEILRAQSARRLEREESLRTMTSLEIESESLREELRQAKEQSDESDRQATLSVERERELLRQTVHSADIMTALVKDRLLVIEVLEREEIEMREKLDAIQKRMHLIGAEGEAMVEEGETRTRQAAAEIGVLRSNTGLAEARVRQLRILVQEHSDLLRTIRRDETEENEEKEMQQLHRAQQKLLFTPIEMGGLNSSAMDGNTYDVGGRTYTNTRSPLPAHSLYTTPTSTKSFQSQSGPYSPSNSSTSFLNTKNDTNNSRKSDTKNEHIYVRKIPSSSILHISSPRNLSANSSSSTSFTPSNIPTSTRDISSISNLNLNFTGKTESSRISFREGDRYDSEEYSVNRGRESRERSPVLNAALGLISDATGENYNNSTNRNKNENEIGSYQKLKIENEYKNDVGKGPEVPSGNNVWRENGKEINWGMGGFEIGNEIKIEKKEEEKDRMREKEEKIKDNIRKGLMNKEKDYQRNIEIKYNQQKVQEKRKTESRRSNSNPDKFNSMSESDDSSSDSISWNITKENRIKSSQMSTSRTGTFDSSDLSEEEIDKINVHSTSTNYNSKNNNSRIDNSKKNSTNEANNNEKINMNNSDNDYLESEIQEPLQDSLVESSTVILTRMRARLNQRDDSDYAAAAPSPTHASNSHSPSLPSSLPPSLPPSHSSLPISISHSTPSSFPPPSHPSHQYNPYPHPSSRPYPHPSSHPYPHHSPYSTSTQPSHSSSQPSHHTSHLSSLPSPSLTTQIQPTTSTLTHPHARTTPHTAHTASLSVPHTTQSAPNTRNRLNSNQNSNSNSNSNYDSNPNFNFNKSNSTYSHNDLSRINFCESITSGSYPEIENRDFSGSGIARRNEEDHDTPRWALRGESIDLSGVGSGSGRPVLGTDGGHEMGVLCNGGDDGDDEEKGEKGERSRRSRRSEDSGRVANISTGYLNDENTGVSDQNTISDNVDYSRVDNINHIDRNSNNDSDEEEEEGEEDVGSALSDERYQRARATLFSLMKSTPGK